MSLKDNALIVSLTVRKPQMSKVDSRGTSAAERANNARGAGEYRKQLYPKHLVAPIKAVEQSARNYLESVAYQWGRGEYMLPTARFMECADELAKYELKFEQSVTAFMQNWVNVLDDARQAQGDMFNASEYPDVNEIRARFSFNVSYAPVTDITDFRVAMRDDELDALRERVEAETKNRMNDLMNEPLERLRAVIARLNEAVGKDERVVTDKRTGMVEVKSPIFRDSVCENIAKEISLLYDFMDVMPSDVMKVAKQVAENTPSPDVLRNSKEARESTKIQTDALLSAIDDLLED